MAHLFRIPDERLLETDLATYLCTLAARLRGLALATSAPVHRDKVPDDPEATALLELAAGQERIARALELAAGRLCDRCKLVPVGESLRLAAGPDPKRYRMSRKIARSAESGPPAWC